MVLHRIEYTVSRRVSVNKYQSLYEFLSSHHATSAAPVEGGEVVVRMLSELGICEYILKYHPEEIS